jgi:DNA polymerase-1
VTEAKLLLLDGHSLAYRAFYALPVENFATSTGQATNAVYGFTSMLINVIRDENPTHVAVAFDVSRKTFRSDAFPEYKAQREKSPPEFAGQVDLVKELLAALDIPTIAVDGFEADDVIATVATQAEAHGVPVAIVTGDRDAFQLVDDRVTVLYPRKGMSDLARMTPEAVEEKYGVTPEQYPDYAALRGDPSDNLPGVPGVGEKTAAKWLQQFGDLTGLVDHADEIGGKVGESFREHLGQVVTNRSLTQLRRDVPLDHPWETFDWSGGSDVKVDEVLDALQFRALRDRLFAIRPASDTPQPLPEVDVTTAVVSIAELLPQLQTGTWSIAVQGTWGAGTGSLQAMAFTNDGNQVSVVDVQEHAWGPGDALSDWLADAHRAKNLHGAKGPALALRAADVVLAGVECDTELAAYILNPGQRSYDLPSVARQYLGREVAVSEADGQLTLGGSDLDVAGLGQQASAVHALAEHFLPALADANSLDLLRNMEIPLSGVLVGMEFDGIAVDIKRLKELSVELATQMRAAELEAHRIVGHEFNLGSPKQLQQVLFEERGLPKTKKIKTGYTTDAEALQGLFAATADPLLEQLLVYRDRTKLRQTVDGLLPLVDANKRIHTTFHQTATATGRLSSSDPNLQNIPVRTETGRRIRGCFIAGPKSEGLLTADYSQIELRIMAHASRDAGLIEAFAEGEDLHTTVASSVFDVDPADVDAEMRRQIKAMSYGLAYGLSAFGLAQQLGIGVDAARTMMNEYFTRFGGVRDYLQRIVAEARGTGYTETLLGRRRYLPDLNSDNRQRREMAERMALNAPIQGTAADIVKVAMLEVHRRLEAEQLSSKLILQVHDELVVQVAPGEREQVTSVVVDAMSGAADLTVPLDVSVGFGKTWDSAAH